MLNGKAFVCSFIFLWMGWLAMGYESQADLVLFHNGDYCYGKVRELSDGRIQVEANDSVKQYKKSQISNIEYGLNEPKNGETVSMGDFTHVGGASILSVTGEDVQRSEVEMISGKNLTLEVENGFGIPVIHIFPTRLPFYNRKGCFVAGILVNSSTRTWSSLEMRAHLYGGKNRVLASKDFYIFKIPPDAPQSSGRRKFELNFPDIDYQSVNRMRIVRKF
ncbi:MAG: hypothetical protein JXR73_16125 [Candidatus Omnitrophica bacterium]|nr:hypothetical protein [Candidatus Omnitrophota bacterium]